MVEEPGDISTMYRRGIEIRMSTLSRTASKATSVSLPRARMAIPRVWRIATELPETRLVSARRKVMRKVEGCMIESVAWCLFDKGST